MQTEVTHGEAVPAPLTALVRMSHEHGHHATTTAGRVALCAIALGVVVRVAARLPQGCRERKVLARAAEELRQVV